jgi:hypothetical protein
MAITPSRGRKPGIFGRRSRSKLRPRLGVIETPSGDGMTTNQQRSDYIRRRTFGRVNRYIYNLSWREGRPDGCA